MSAASGAADAPTRGGGSRGCADASGSLVEAPAALADADTFLFESPLPPSTSPSGVAPLLSRALSRAEEAALNEAKEGNLVRNWDHFELTPGAPVLGSGSFGKVLCVRRKGCPDVLYALKQPHDTLSGVAQIAAEYGVLQRLQALARAWLPECAIDSGAMPVVRVHGVFLGGPHPGLLLEHHGISLAVALEARALDEAARVRVACDVASAGRYMHKHDVVHRDLKSANVLVNPADGFRAKARCRWAAPHVSATNPAALAP
jgi:hypothetical protein